MTPLDHTILHSRNFYELASSLLISGIRSSSACAASSRSKGSRWRAGKCPCYLAVPVAHGKRQVGEFGEHMVDKLCHRHGEPQLSNSNLGGDFEYRNGANEQAVFRILQNLELPRPQPRIVPQHPEEGMGVQEYIHKRLPMPPVLLPAADRRNYRAISILPLNAPHGRAISFSPANPQARAWQSPCRRAQSIFPRPPRRASGASKARSSPCGWSQWS